MLSILILLSLAGCKYSTVKKAAQVQKTESEVIKAGIVDSVYSTILQENRKLWIYVPNQFNHSLFTGQQQYPVAYLLDGDAHFLSFTGMVDQLSEQNGNMVCPDMMVVGILDVNRSRDFTPTVDTTEEDESGGSEKFNAFIEQELIPYIDAKYHPAPFRMLIGHSYGGLMVLNTLLHHARPFNAFIAIDPSLSWDNLYLLKQTDTALQTIDFRGKYLFVGIANTMSTDENLDEIKKDTTAESRHIRSIFSFVDKLKKQQPKNLKWDYDYYEDEDHYSVPLRAEYDALHFVFRFFPFTAIATLEDSTVSADSARNIIIAHFQYESEQLGYRVLPPEKFINDLAYNFMSAGMPAKARAFFQLNIDNYPVSRNVYDSMGEFLESQNDTATSKSYFNKALAIGVSN